MLEEGTTAPEMMLLPYMSEPADGFTDAIDVHRGSTDEGDDETDCCCQQSWNHQNAEPTDIKAVIGRSYPLAEIVPSGSLLS